MALRGFRIADQPESSSADRDDVDLLHDDDDVSESLA